jgi:hypothetical protein
MTLMAAVALAGTDDKAAKPVISCDKIVETYKLNKSVDETAGTLMIEQSRVTECLKAAGITPSENDR